MGLNVEAPEFRLSGKDACIQLYETCLKADTRIRNSTPNPEPISSQPSTAKSVNPKTLNPEP